MTATKTTLKITMVIASIRRLSVMGFNAFFHYLYLTVNTGQLASLTTSDVTLPNTKLLSLDRPLGPTRIKSMRLSLA